MKLEALKRLQDYQIFAADIEENGHHLEKGHNSYRCKNPKDAYERAAHFIANLIHAGFAFFPKRTSVKLRDTYKRGNVEISIWVCNGVLNIDLSAE
jgi:hypothetical protein